MRYIISGGGTGGHIYPAIAIANALKEKEPLAEILFVGAIGKMEMTKVPEAGYKIEGLPVAGIQRKLSFNNLVKNLLFPFKLGSSLFKAFQILKKFKPEVVIGVGGYASGPIVAMAQLLNIPTLIQEQNSYAGITNKWLGKGAKLVCVAYPEMQKAFPADQVLFTGNPVRQSLTKVKSRKQEQDLIQLGFELNKPLILAIGGSLGARTINLALLQHHQIMIASGMQLLWQTGKSGYESTMQKLQMLYPNGLPQQLQVKEFIVDMDSAYSAATVVISRAGALSISELALVGKPAILVPSPNVAEDHQTKNAMALVRLGAAVMIQDQDLDSQLINQLKTFFDNPKSIDEISEAIGQQAKPNAASDIAAAIINLKTYTS